MKKSLVILSSLLLLSTANVAFAQDSDHSERIAEIEAQISELKVELKELRSNSTGEVIGETFAHGEIEATIVDVYLTEERNEWEEAVFNNILTIEYKIMNNTDDGILAGYDFELYVNGEKAEHYFLLDDNSDVVSAGRSITVKQSFGFDSDSDDLELEFSDTHTYPDDEKPIIIPLVDLETK